MATKLDHALALAAKGFWVFRLKPDGKLPYRAGWQDEATRDPQEIKRLFAGTDLNIGVFTEKFMDDKALVAVDEDNKGTKRGADTLFQLDFDGLSFPPTFTQTTPTGGRHHLYISPRAVKQGTQKLGDGLDIRSRGGYVVGAGSTIEGVAYGSNDNDLSEVPEWLFTKLAVDEMKPKKVAEGIVIDKERAYRRAMEYITTRAAIPEEGQRNDTAFKVAAEIKDFGNDEAVCFEVMMEWNGLLEEPLDDPEIETVVGSAYKTGQNDIGAKAPEACFNVLPSAQVVAKEVETKRTDRHPLDIMNDDHAFVIAGGGHHILHETTDVKGNFKLEHLNEQTFHRKYAYKMFQSGQKPEPLTKVWMSWEGTRRYDGLVFAPGREVDPRFYNMWRGFTVLPLADGEKIEPEWQAALDKFIEHARDNCCQGDEGLFRWLMGYFAHLIQRPWEKPLVALVFRGRKGVGKNAILARVAALLGCHSMTTAKRRYLMSNFNGHMESLLMFTLDEAYWSGDKEAEGVVKDLITGTTHTIERKGQETYDVDNLTRVCVIGNEEWLVPATEDERRFGVFNVGEGRMQDRAFFTQMRTGMEAGGYRLLLKYLLEYDLRGIDVNNAPSTQGLSDQKMASLEPFGQWWMDCLHDGELIGAAVTDYDFTEVSTSVFRNAFQNYMRQRNIRARLPDERSIGRDLKKFAPSITKKKIRDGGYIYYCTGGLTQLRQDFEKYVKGKVTWETTTEEEHPCLQ